MKPDYLQSAINNAPKYKYDMSKRGTGIYKDCSSFVCGELAANGYDVNPNTTTATMPKELQKAGFKMLELDPDDLKPGDILWIAAKNGKPGHTEFYLGNGKTVGARNSRKGVGIFNYYKGMATHYFRKI